MFKSIFNFRVGSRWLFFGFRTSGGPFFCGVFRSGVVDYRLRFLWLEVSLSELPF
jgi:hypothetical protein